MPKCRENWRRKRRRAAYNAKRRRLRSRKRKAIREALIKQFRGPSIATPIILDARIETLRRYDGTLRYRVNYDPRPAVLNPAALIDRRRC